jgi:hypothetical protein
VFENRAFDDRVLGLKKSAEAQDQAQQAFPLAEIAAASAEFFAALRLLLNITEG